MLLPYCPLLLFVMTSPGWVDQGVFLSLSQIVLYIYIKISSGFVDKGVFCHSVK